MNFGVTQEFRPKYILKITLQHYKSICAFKKHVFTKTIFVIAEYWKHPKGHAYESN
jgi:hypothetical protein